MQRKMTSVPIMAAGAAFVLTPLFAPAPAHADARSDVQAKTKTFYRWYVGQLNRDRDPIKNRAMIRRNVSRRLYRWLYSSAYREYGADYFLQAQDFDSDWTSVRTSAFRLKADAATLTAILGEAKAPAQAEAPGKGKEKGNDQAKAPGIGRRKLRLKWVREGRVWKLDRVDDQ